jgi:hypothetical protein
MKPWMLLAAGLLFVTACKKYEEGPYLSFTSKNKRLENHWVATGGFSFTDPGFPDPVLSYQLILTRDGDITVVYPDLISNDTLFGEWEWMDRREVIQWELEPGDTLSFYYTRFERFDVLRLTGNDLWLIDKDNNRIFFEPL